MLRFLPVEASAVTRWSRPARLDFLHRLRMAPVADTELLHLSHYCPVVVLSGDGEPTVVVLLDPSMLAADPVGKNGLWRHAYAPIALRNLPFWPGSRRSEIEVAPELVGGADDGYPLRDAAGRPSEQFAAVTTWIGRLQEGMRRLSEAAKMLIAADVLTPLGVREAGARDAIATRYLTVDPDSLAALDNERAAALSAHGCLPLDLAAACLFSRRLLARSVELKARESDAGPGFARAAPIAAPDEPFDASLRLDSSPLFSFELFENPALRPDAHADA